MSIEWFAMQAGSYPAELTRRGMYAWAARTAANTPGIIAGGLIASGDLALSAPVSGMTVNVAAGECLVGGSEGGTQGGYYFRNTAQASLSIAASNPTNPRVDLVCATVGDAAYTIPTGGTSGAATLQVLTGTPTPGATLTNLSGAPTLPLSSLLLGYVLVPANATNIITADISNVATQLVPSVVEWLSGTDATKPSATTYKGFNYYATDTNALYYSDGTTWRTIYGSRGAVSIATTESRTNTAYGTMPTPDQVTNVVLPTNSLIFVAYQATWQNSVASAARAALFLNTNEYTTATTGFAAPAVIDTPGPGTAGQDFPLASGPAGLATVSSAGGGYTGDVTTGQLLGVGSNGGLCVLFAAAGTYTVSVQFKASSGSVTVKNRKLWVQVIPFS